MNSWPQLLLIYGNEAGARVAFEEACVLTISTKFKDENVQGVKVYHGDGGIDVYVGLLGVEPVDVYQCKFFLNGIGDSQKKQIRDSYTTASESKSFQLKGWFLCLPQDLSVDEALWFDEWAAKKTSTKPQRISPIKLLEWAQEANIANFIFQRKDSQKLDEILSLVRGTETGNWRGVVEDAEADSAKILMTLIRRHVRAVDYKCPELNNLAEKAATGDRDAICDYTKSVLVSRLEENEKVWFFNYLSDFTGEPILHRFIRRYRILIDRSKKNGEEEALSTTEFYSTYMSIMSPAIAHLRAAAHWPDLS